MKWNKKHFSNCPRPESAPLTLSWRKPLSYRNQSIYLLRKSMDWFLYDNGLRHERVKDTFFWRTSSMAVSPFLTLIRSNYSIDFIGISLLWNVKNEKSFFQWKTFSSVILPKYYFEILLRNVYVFSGLNTCRVSEQLPPRKITTRLGLKLGLGLVFGLGAIFLGTNCPRTHT